MSGVFSLDFLDQVKQKYKSYDELLKKLDLEKTEAYKEKG